jgi:50S ribosomal subunit-associated GTPase HflX
VFVSALTGEGLDALRATIAQAIVASREAPREDVERDARFARDADEPADSDDNAPDDDSGPRASLPSSDA